MSTESFTCCDNPTCNAAIGDNDPLVGQWFSASFTAEDDTEWMCNEDNLPRVDACSLKCLGEAVAAFDYDGFVEGNKPL